MKATISFSQVFTIIVVCLLAYEYYLMSTINDLEHTLAEMQKQTLVVDARGSGNAWQSTFATTPELVVSGPTEIIKPKVKDYRTPSASVGALAHGRTSRTLLSSSSMGFQSSVMSDANAEINRSFGAQ